MSGSWGQAGEGELSGGSFAVYDALRLAIEVLKEANIEGRPGCCGLAGMKPGT